MSRRRWSAEEMRELLQEKERSGLSLKAFAEAAGVATTTLAWWRARLRAGIAPRLVPVGVVEGVVERGIAVEIVVGDVLVRMADTDAQAFARLVRALPAC